MTSYGAFVDIGGVDGLCHISELSWNRMIGMQLPMDRIAAGVELLAKGKEDTEEAGLDAAKAIMTTDTKPKYVGVEIEIGGKTVTIGGMCKGSGMIHPNMCTMLGFVTTDAAITKELLQKALNYVNTELAKKIAGDGEGGNLSV